MRSTFKSRELSLCVRVLYIVEAEPRYRGMQECEGYLAIQES